MQVVCGRDGEFWDGCRVMLGVQCGDVPDVCWARILYDVSCGPPLFNNGDATCAVWGRDVCSGRGEFVFGVSDWDVLELVGIDVPIMCRRIRVP